MFLFLGERSKNGVTVEFSHIPAILLIQGSSFKFTTWIVPFYGIVCSEDISPAMIGRIDAEKNDSIS